MSTGLSLLVVGDGGTRCGTRVERSHVHPKALYRDHFLNRDDEAHEAPELSDFFVSFHFRAQARFGHGPVQSIDGSVRGSDLLHVEGSKCEPRACAFIS